MSRSVGIFCPEGRTESVDFAECGGSEFALELSAYGQAGLLAEKILAVINLPLLVLWNIFKVKRGNCKHLSGTFAV